MLRTLPTTNYDDFIASVQDRGKMSRLRQELGLSVPQQVTLIKAYVFRYYAREVVNNPITEADIVMMREGRKVVELAEGTMFCTPEVRLRFFTSLGNFASQLREWLLVDRPRVAYPFATKFNQLRRLRKEVDDGRPYYVTEMKQLIDLSHLQLIGIIHALGGEDVLATLDATLESTPVDEELVADFRRNAIIAFWDTFQEQLPSYLPVVRLLVDFIHRYCRLDQNNARKRLLVEESLDVEFIKQQIESQVVGGDQLRGYLRIVLDATKAISAQVDEEGLEQRFGALIISREESFLIIRNFFQQLFAYYDDLGTRVTAALQDPIAYGIAASLS